MDGAREIEALLAELAEAGKARTLAADTGTAFLGTEGLERLVSLVRGALDGIGAITTEEIEALF